MARQPKVAIYVRVSTDEQNPDSQLRDLREYVRSRGWTDVVEYVDLGVSGAKDSRPKWNELWDAIQKGRVHILMTHALDRLGRSLAHLVKIIFTLTERNVTLVSFRENIDLSTAQGRLIASIFAVLAEYELSMIRERTRAGMRSAKARGSKIGNQKRFFDKKKATELRDQGLGQIRIARKLGIGVGRVNRWAQEEYLPPEKRSKLIPAGDAS
jgi:DNA invertase Pin-like site-specific DNA recombinase